MVRRVGETVTPQGFQWGPMLNLKMRDSTELVPSCHGMKPFYSYPI